MTTASTRTSRVNMRIAPDALDVLRAAADRQQQDLSAFVLGAAMDRARSVLLEEGILHLGPQAVQQLEAALDAEPEVVPQLARLLNR